MKLDRWVIHGNVILGRLYDAVGFAPGSWVSTDAIVEFDTNGAQARCLDGDYDLKEPGTLAEYDGLVPVRVFMGESGR